MSIGRNTLFNIASASVPLVVSLVTIPLYLRQIGTARYGVLSIVLLLLGYFGLFDLGLSRAATNELARLRGATVEDRESVFWSALLSNLVLGLIGGLVLYWAGEALLSHVLRVSPILRWESIAALPYAAAAVPLVTVAAVFSGALEAGEYFGVLGVLQGVGSTMLLCVPLAAAYLVGVELQVLVCAIFLVRAIALVPLVAVAITRIPLRHTPVFRAAHARNLVGYGVWVTITNIVGPVLTSVDRFLIGALSGASAVAFYDVPSRIVNRAGVLPASLSRALFPSVSLADPQDGLRTSLKSVRVLAAVMTPLVVLSVVALRPLMHLWLGGHFARESAPIGEVLLLGVWINALTYVPFSTLQAQGRPDLVAKAHLAEVVPFVLLLWWAIHTFGLMGAAWAWTARVTVDAVVQFWLARMHVDGLFRHKLDALVVLGTWIAVHYLSGYGAARYLLCASFLGLAFGASWRQAPELRRLVKRVLRQGTLE